MAKKKSRPLHRTRRLVQIAFLLVTLVAVFGFGANAEAWCPFGGVEAAYEYITAGTALCSLGVSNFYILASVLLLTLLLRRVFCGYMCPIGSISELLYDAAKRLGFKPKDVTGTPDRLLSLLKYPVLLYILYISWKAAELLFRGFDPVYALISRHGKDITMWSYVVLGAIVLGSLFVRIPFCRWLCPMAAVMNPISRFGLFRIERHDESCTACGLCDKVCPVAIPVSEVEVVNHARCYSCMECLEACPPKAQGSLTFGPKLGREPGARPRLSQAWVVLIIVGLVSAAAAADHLWPLPSFVKERGTAPAATASLELGVSGVTCRGSSTGLWNFIQRDDEFALPGYLRLETWPGGEFARVRVVFDPSQADDDTVRQAIVTPVFTDEGDWFVPDYTIEGYDPLGLSEP
jgi:ferredoxin